MSTKLPKITSSDAVRVIKKLGFILDRQSGSHAIFFHPEKRLRTVIPIHKKEILKPKTLLGILDDASISVEQLRELL
jgi:predicted RNA binding protein YcfA (HicA-like mRNA interferase family)